MDDFLTFRRMITPVLIQILFWLGAAGSVLFGLVAIGRALALHDFERIAIGLLLVIAGPLIIRVYCELLILLFRMNETLTDICNRLR